VIHANAGLERLHAEIVELVQSKRPVDAVVLNRGLSKPV